MKPIIKYRGGKSKEIKNFLHFIPCNYKRYVEPFAGGAALFFYLEPQCALINDINSKLIDFYWTVQNNYDEFKKELIRLEKIYQFNQKEYEELKKRGQQDFVENKNEYLYYSLRDMFNGKIEKKYLDATLYYFINKTSYSGMLRFNSKGEFNVPFGRYKNFNAAFVSEEHHALLKRTKITKGDYSKIFDTCSTEDFVFLDPPYDLDISKEAVKLILEYKLLNENGIIIIETDEKERELRNLKKMNVEIYDSRKYGRANLIFLAERG